MQEDFRELDVDMLNESSADLIGIAAECIDIRFDPCNSHPLIKDTIVAFEIIRSVSSGIEAKDTYTAAFSRF
jgi:hypothetical protein